MISRGRVGVSMPTSSVHPTSLTRGYAAFICRIGGLTLRDGRARLKLSTPAVRPDHLDGHCERARLYV